MTTATQSPAKPGSRGPPFGLRLALPEGPLLPYRPPRKPAERALTTDFLTLPVLTDQSPLLADEERVEVQRWALELSRIDDPEAR